MYFIKDFRDLIVTLESNESNEYLDYFKGLFTSGLSVENGNLTTRLIFFMSLLIMSLIITYIFRTKLGSKLYRLLSISIIIAYTIPFLVFNVPLMNDYSNEVVNKNLNMYNTLAVMTLDLDIILDSDRDKAYKIIEDNINLISSSKSNDSFTNYSEKDKEDNINELLDILYTNKEKIKQIDNPTINVVEYVYNNPYYNVFILIVIFISLLFMGISLTVPYSKNNVNNNNK